MKQKPSAAVKEEKPVEPSVPRTREQRHAAALLSARKVRQRRKWVIRVSGLLAGGLGLARQLRKLPSIGAQQREAVAVLFQVNTQFKGYDRKAGEIPPLVEMVNRLKPIPRILSQGLAAARGR